MAAIRITSIPAISYFSCADLTPDLRILAYGSEDNKIRLFDSESLLSNSCKLISFLLLQNSVSSLCWSPHRYLDDFALAVGTITGILYVITKTESGWSIIVGTMIHSADIKDVKWTSDYILTAGVDNALIMTTLAYEASYYQMKIARKIILHEGWVTGISVTEHWLVSQGSDNTCKVWSYPDMELKFQLVHSCDMECVELVKKPCFGKLICLAGCFSGVTGFPCLTMVEPHNWQVVQMHLGIQSRPREDLKRAEPQQEFAHVKCSVVVKDALIVGSSAGLYCVSLSTLEVIWMEDLNVQILVMCIQDMTCRGNIVLITCEDGIFYINADLVLRNKK